MTTPPVREQDILALTEPDLPRFHRQQACHGATLERVTDTVEPPLLRASTTPPGVQRYAVCGIPITDLDVLAAAKLIIRHAAVGKSFQVHLCNAFTLSLVDRDPLMREALLAADLNLPDGAPVAWMGRGMSYRGPVRGPGLVNAVATAGIGVARHYLWGGKEGVAEGMAEGLRAAVPSVEIVGTETPPFGQPTDDELFGLADRVRASSANMVWIGVGTPRQDYIVHRLAPLLDMPIVPVGAAFDFWAGTVREAPAFLHGSGLEWVYRFSREPGRLWRRYLIGNPQFVMSAWRHRH
jgi:N-acetylglucosaminyldiphosphoundecaprenol N-acetyl-beta-D-mannosaminyltransferase